MNRPVIGKRLEVRLSITVGFFLLAFSLIAGTFTYHFTYRFQINLAAEQQQQLVRTVQSQAEVAVFARNEKIAEGVIEGLLANPLILAARIESKDHFKVELGSRNNIRFEEGKRYPLFSPIDQIETIGVLILVQNSQKIEETARDSAFFLSFFLLGQVLFAAIIMSLVLRFMAIHPITLLANAMVAIEPGSPTRLPIAVCHTSDEIGLLTHGVNTLLDAAETAINKVKAQHEELERMATHDHLTGLPTLRLAEDRLRMACANAERTGKKVALLFIDLDGFKAINDTLGHEMGDVVLKETANLLRLSIRAEDTAGRIGGDEFLVILGGISHAEEPALVAEKIIATMTRTIDMAGHSLRMGASIGIALYPDNAKDIDALRHAADLAMYQVKKSGKGAYAFA